ncbi:MULTISPECIES: uracil-xanthine permease family protein [Pseudanabaena]|jgi:xanthine permease XanP|uniref:uracil-xanthine permease family protein n=1 Tax=Pseudanabaena TaxID=1152 RepID=UPI002479C4D7|nr:MULTISPECIES: nucleobase:cation symporter-2 family protein [Pseudanabaena]MEA5485480.1 nucleobase:cation symporter-2 family protein [Pseudanabaena sp. CCNP1317]WGS73697.1 nucleobase:cation symporter-2 family protein [Pseudanabaena galeata CCNP1313]
MDADKELNIDIDIDEASVTGKSSLIYGLNDVPPMGEAIFVAFQHVLAAFVGIITPPIIICASLGLDSENTSFLISMSLFASGVCTFIQCKRIGPVGSGLLSLQGTSFAFLGPILGIGAAVKAGGGSPEQALALIFGVCLFGSFVEIILSRFLHLLDKVITPVVSGTVVMIIGLGLIKTGMISLAGGAAALAKNDGSFGSVQNLALGGTVLLIVVILTLSKNRFLRMGSIAIGLAVGFIISLFLGIVNFSSLGQLPFFRVPMPFRFGISFDFATFLPFILLYVLTAIETVGDLTATSAVSGEPVKGGVYLRRIKGGVLGDGINSLIASVLNTFPNTTFSQNNGVIQMTGVGSRYVGFFVAGIFVILGLLPVVGGVFQALPQSVLGGATLVMFGSIAVAGLNIVVSAGLDRRSMIIVAVSLGLGLGVVFAPEVFANKPAIFRNLFGSAISTGGLTAILLSWLLPRIDEPVVTVAQESAV